MNERLDTPAQEKPQPKWQPIGPLERRVVGVLIEKAKTTPAGYPLTLNSILTGCKQKSNRHPSMDPTADEVEEALDRLRALGAIGEVQGDGRVPKYRHYMYDWLDVNKVELSVMAELLLRGEQTLGDLRARAARMDPIPDQAALLPIVRSLMDKGLIVALTPEGRGQMVTHALYEEDEMRRLRQRFGSGGEASAPRMPTPTASSAEPYRPTASSAAAPGATASSPSPSPVVSSGEVAALKEEMNRLREEIQRLRKDVDDLWANLT